MLGRVLNHAAYSLALSRKHPELSLRNLLTVPVLMDDAISVWREFGDHPARVRDTISHLTIEADSIMPWYEQFEIPTPFYVDAGGGWLLMPMFGGLLNSAAGLVKTLQTRHRSEWDAAVGLREDYFRADLQTQFPPPRYSSRLADFNCGALTEAR
jgi:hypothetical protein